MSKDLLHPLHATRGALVVSGPCWWHVRLKTGSVPVLFHVKHAPSVSGWSVPGRLRVAKGNIKVLASVHSFRFWYLYFARDFVHRSFQVSRGSSRFSTLFQARCQSVLPGPEVHAMKWYCIAWSLRAYRTCNQKLQLHQRS